MDFSRRAMLGAMGGLAVGGSLAAMSGNVIAAPAAPVMSPGKDGHFMQMHGEFGWKPHKIDDIAAAMDVAYKGYWYKGYGCGYGAFYAIVGTMAEKYGAPYNTSPSPSWKCSRAASVTGVPSAALSPVPVLLSPCSLAAKNPSPW